MVVRITLALFLLADITYAKSNYLAMLNTSQGTCAPALGGAYVAATENGDAVWYNPASSAGRGGLEIGASHASWIGDTSNEFLYLTWGSSTFGAACYGIFAGTQDIQRDSLGTDIGVFANSFMTTGMSISGNYRGLSVGIGGRLTQQSIFNKNATDSSADLGAIWKKADGRLSLGASARNLGAKSEDGAAKPSSQSVGLVAKISQSFVIFVQQDLAGETNLNATHVGLEFPFSLGSIVMTPRCGWESGLGAESNLSGAAFGMGLKKGGFLLNYAYQTLGYLGDTHRFSLGYFFGQTKTTDQNVGTTSLSKGDEIKLGLQTYANGNFANALGHFQKAVGLKPETAADHYRIGLTLLKLDKKDDAFSHFRRCLQLDPNRKELKAWLDQQK